MNKKVIYDLTHGLYVLTTKDGGCMVDAVSQVSAGENPCISVSVMKDNNTNKLMHENDTFALSIFSMESNPNIIKTFGFNSMRDINKFDEVETDEVDGINIIKDSIGYIILEKIDTIELDTHTLFIGKIKSTNRFNLNKPMSYNYYQDYKDELIKVQTENNKTAWVCTVCGYVYYGEEIPDDFKCPLCGAGKDLFIKKIGEER